ncbi:delta fatty acid desaturase [Geodermatophilus sp. Leaf369]|uniref:fatty acid desaturase family protein n=1 Tax=Geodermatophilus sp. Leaf369 TaxID=1736354 RepID=UPI0006F32883|nr:acyl-CoA desaturase [Geodermatophilus sp. Leaf369]KQS54152.1 delta fatty acid desaturase [Geodermatophilus sp. Leaf369]
MTALENAAPAPAPTRAGAGARPPTLYAQLAEEVQAAGLMRRRVGWYVTTTAVVLAVTVGAWVAFVVLGDSWWTLAVAAVLAVTSAQFGFLGHDAAHRQVFASGTANAWAARVVAGACAGLSMGWWTSKHNRHHSGPNQVDRDPDIATGVLVFDPADAPNRTHPAARWFLDRQGWAFFPLLLLEGVQLHVAGVRDLLTRRDVPHRRLKLGIIVARLVGFLVAVAVVLPPGKAAAFVAVQLGLFGLLMGGAFAPNHKGMPIVPAGTRIDFLSRQVLMSRNIDGGRVTDVAMGGLNYQIEHHLFPSMPRPALRQAQPIVRRFCDEHGVRYTQTSLVGSYGIVVRYLNRVGLGERDPFTCPLVQQRRA